MKIFHLFIAHCSMSNDLEHVARQSYTAVDPNERAIAHKFS